MNTDPCSSLVLRQGFGHRWKVKWWMNRGPRILPLSAEADIYTHRERDSICWILAKLTGRKKSPGRNGNDPLFYGVLHEFGARL
jgi:hypothetical protein